ncbi:MAG: hypothetical protein GC164_07175 [Phycisphaera sp.]|nr:hypothetical protein [Phycisphaera sp.]
MPGLMRVLPVVLCLLLGTSFIYAEEPATFESLVEGSLPLEFGTVIRKNGAVLTVTHYLMEKPYLSQSVFSGPNSLSVEGDKMTVLIGKELHRLTIPKQDKGKLTHDESFGTHGVMAYDPKESTWQPAENFPNFMRHMSSRKLGDMVGYVEKDPFYHLQIKNAAGEDVASLGTDKDPGKICFLKNACRWKDLVFIVDANCRDIMVWTISGKYLFEFSSREMGVDYPWMMSIDITDQGELYLGFTQERIRKSNGARNSGIAETAFLKITGLETINPDAESPKETP